MNDSVRPDTSDLNNVLLLWSRHHTIQFGISAPTLNQTQLFSCSRFIKYSHDWLEKLQSFVETAKCQKRKGLNMNMNGFCMRWVEVFPEMRRMKVLVLDRHCKLSYWKLCIYTENKDFLCWLQVETSQTSPFRDKKERECAGLSSQTPNKTKTQFGKSFSRTSINIFFTKLWLLNIPINEKSLSI